MTTTTLAVGGDVPIALVDGKAPTELRLFRAGENHSTKGTYLFDDQAAQEVMSTYEQMGRGWVIADYDHGSLQKNPVDPSRSSRAAGRARRLELRDGELWACDITWTPDAKAAIEAGEWPSISPAFAHGDDGRPTWLINFGLTGNPALFAPAELAAANVLRAALAAIARGDGSGAPLTTNESPPAAPAARLAHETTKAGSAAPATTRMNTMMGSTLGQMMAAKGKTAKDLADMLGCSEQEAMGLMMPAASEIEIESAKRQGEMMMSAVALSVGLTAGTKQPDVVSRLSALAAFEREVLAATKAPTTAEALGSISGLVSTQAQAQQAISELASVKMQRSKDAIEAMLSAAKAEKKLTPAEFDDQSETGLRATALSMADKGEEWLKAHLAKRVPHTVLSTQHTQPETNPEQQGEKAPGSQLAGKKYSELSNMEKDQLSREKPEAFEKLRQEHLNSLPQGGTFPLHDRQSGLFRDLPS